MHRITHTHTHTHTHTRTRTQHGSPEGKSGGASGPAADADGGVPETLMIPVMGPDGVVHEFALRRDQIYKVNRSVLRASLCWYT